MGEPARHTGSSRRSGSGSRSSARLRAGALAIGCALGLLGVTVAPPALADPTSSDTPVNVTIATVQPVAPGPTGQLVITGEVTNTGSGTVSHPHVGLELGSRNKALATRSDIASLFTRGGPTSADGKELTDPQPVQLGDLAAGASAPFTLSVQMTDLKLDQSGVYELAVDVQDDNDRVVGIGRTVLPYFADPTKDGQPTQVATLWPITHAPELVAQTADPDQTPVLRDDSLITDLGPTGRLGQLVAIGAKIPSLTWVIDPELLDTVFAMTKPYRVQLAGHGGEPAGAQNTKPGVGAAAATAWLAALRTAVAANGSQVVALPYGDPDLASIAHNGAGLAGLDTVIGKARTAGKVTVEGRLSTDVTDTVAWPYQGALDQPTAAVAKQLGGTTVLVNGSSMPESSSLLHTPNAARPIGNGQTAVVADSTVSALFQNDLKTPQSRTAAEQRFLAETLEVTLQEPNVPRTMLVMPPRDLTVASAQTLADSLAAAQSGKWTSPATLDNVTAAAADARANTSVPGADSYPGNLRGTELSTKDLASVAEMQQNVDRLVRILSLPQRVSSPFSAAMLRSVSTEWRTQQKTGQDFRLNATAYLAQLTDAVAITPKSSVVTLAGDSGLLQVSVRNDLNQTVLNLELRLTSSQPNRLNVSQPGSITLGAGQSASLRFTAQAKGNGVVPMSAQLFTVGPDSQPYGPEVQFKVDVTHVPSGVWWVVGSGVLLVLLAGLRIYLKRKKGVVAPEDPDAPLVPEDDADGGDGAPQAEKP
ncbi:hypothetical protein P3T37_004008 [Kitasatospora sp. MAA4]|uniref:DUF6049 family protein n=1 Tax=Kitasatospora sp. MAA4 TaxID=3035093 RepID=UPI002472EBDE|nr:DUF6049 family protein [Kitasatospora sp. MAA4]MDH6134604.1 hypothetical protein [Kitasatospora sp. MAA4]